MKLKINKYKLEIILILFAICQFFAIFKTGNYIFKADLINISVIVLSVIFIIINKFIPILQKKDNGIKKYIIIYLILYIIEIIYSTYKYSIYGQKFTQTIASSISEMSIIVFFPMLFLQKKIDNKDYLKNIIKNIGVIASVLSIAQVILYKYNIVFLDITGTSIRYDNLRFGIGTYLVAISFIITFCDFLKEYKVKDLIIFFVECMFFLYAVKTRSIMIYIIIAIMISILFFYKSIKVKGFLILAGISFIALIIFSGFGNSFIDSLSVDDSYNIRFKTIEYYMNQFYQNPILGVGYIKQNISTSLTAILMGDEGYYYRDDVGIVGLINEKGIVGLIMYFIYLKILIKMSIELYKKDKSKYMFLLVISVYVIICSVNLIYFSPAIIAIAFVILSMVCNYYNEEINNRL